MSDETRYAGSIHPPSERCHALRSYLLHLDGHEHQVWVQCTKHWDHESEEHESRSPETGRRLKWRDDYRLANYLEFNDDKGDDRGKDGERVLAPG